MNVEALLLSLRLAATVSFFLLVLALPLAYGLAFSTWRGKFLLESVVALPLVLPPTVLGFYALVAMGPHGPLGKIWQSLFGHPLAFTFAGLVLAVLLSVLITGQVAGDGRSDWLKGAQLLAVYLVLALTFYFLPSTPPH